MFVKWRQRRRVMAAVLERQAPHVCEQPRLRDFWEVIVHDFNKHVWILNFRMTAQLFTSHASQYAIWECGGIFYSLFQFVQFQSEWKCTDGFSLVDWRRVWADFMTLVYKRLSLYLQLSIRFCFIKYQNLVSLSWYKAMQNIAIFTPPTPHTPISWLITQRSTLDKLCIDGSTGSHFKSLLF